MDWFRPIIFYQPDYVSETIIPLNLMIAHVAVQLIPEKRAVILNTGSTIQCVAKALVMKSRLTIISNAINIVQPLSGTDNDIFLVGY